MVALAGPRGARRDARDRRGRTSTRARATRLWRKGETSGNVLRVVDIALDCDADALLLTVDPAGPTATAARARASTPRARSRRAAAAQGFAWLETLWATIDERAAHAARGLLHRRACSTAASTRSGARSPKRRPRCCIAAKDDAAAEPPAPTTATRAALAGETADLLYHTLVLLAERGLEPAEVLDVLRARHARLNGGSSARLSCPMIA